MDVILPETATGLPAVCLVHGGGWYAGSRDAFHEVMEWFAARGYPCASVGYRTDEESTMAEKMADAATGYLRFAELLGERGERAPVLMGSSAGAHLATMLAETGPAPWAPELASPWRIPSGCIPINGPGTLLEWEGIPAQIKESVQKLCRTTYEMHPDAFRSISPEHHVTGDLPPFLILLAEDEKVFPHSYVHAWAQKLRKSGTQAEVRLIPGTEHGFLYSTQGAPQREALAAIERFLSTLASKPQASDPEQPAHA
ncbi:alpha/beta hydrolase [Sinomonas sp. JGH33]|uniref:Alpha/beta hydrolase n=1 Tax=Sinomonas terricola TaxID=3110330 RepID=A0ABU5TDU8_9MICC|nr:alpha/beta hydrolase [Sinomonas sp. JGH33]MEA5457266.1 alpha/beta hydrolase [Sinomonas sp. JGH33]